MLRGVLSQLSPQRTSTPNLGTQAKTTPSRARRRVLPAVVAAMLVSALASTSAAAGPTQPATQSPANLGITGQYAVAGLGADLREYAIASGRMLTTNKRYTKLYVDPSGSAVDAAKQARKKGRTAVAKNIEIISKTSQARWFGDWNSTSTVRKDVAKYISGANKAKARPTIVLYAIPGRDCGSYSAGGFNKATYQKWITEVAAGLKGSKAIIVLEPDSLAQDCGNNARNDLLKWATKKLTAAGAWVYLDGGHSNWRTPAEMAKRLKAAGITEARGFATNVSNYNTTANEKKYGNKIAAELKKLKVTTAHTNYVVDTARNGKALKTSEWCNRKGAGLGAKPKLVSDSTQLDGLLWIKRPGESDGTCNGGPAAGSWWEKGALELVKNRAK